MNISMDIVKKEGAGKTSTFSINYVLLKNELNFSTREGGFAEYFIVFVDKVNLTVVSDIFLINFTDTIAPVLTGFSYGDPETGEDFIVNLEIVDNVEETEIKAFLYWQIGSLTRKYGSPPGSLDIFWVDSRVVVGFIGCIDYHVL